MRGLVRFLHTMKSQLKVISTKHKSTVHIYIYIYIFISFPKYLILGPSNVFRGKAGSLPNIRKNGDSFECSLGIKLYAAHARGIKTSYSNCGATYLAIQDLRKAWNPSILPFRAGWYGEV